jgi:hypothetical protein
MTAGLDGRSRAGRQSPADGHKRHALVDTEGRGLVLQTHPASVQDRDGAPPLLKAFRTLDHFPERASADRVATATHIVVKTVRKSCESDRLRRAPAALALGRPVGFAGRRLAWTRHNRCPAKDFEATVAAPSAGTQPTFHLSGVDSPASRLQLRTRISRGEFDAFALSLRRSASLSYGG